MTLLELLKRIFSGKPPRVPNTWDFSKRYWGHDYAVIEVVSGTEIRVTGWCSGMQVGDYVILQQQVGTTRYQLTQLSYYSDPPDMWEATAKFAPR